MTENFANLYSTTLSAAVTDTSGTSVSVTSATGAPSANFRILIDTEYMLVTNVSGTTFTVTRGVEGSTAATHSSGAVVTHVLTAGGLAKGTLPYPDQPPTGGGSSSDNEFETTDTSNPPSGWTAMGTLDAVDINSTVPSHLYLQHNAQSGTHCQGIYKSIPGGPSYPFTVTAKVSDAHLRANFNQVGLFIGVTTPGQFESVIVTFDSSLSVFVKRMSSPTANGGAVNAASISGPTPPLYLRIKGYASNDCEWLFSFNGMVYISMIRENPGFTPATYGFYVNPENSTYPAIGLFDWVRFT